MKTSVSVLRTGALEDQFPDGAEEGQQEGQQAALVDVDLSNGPSYGSEPLVAPQVQIGTSHEAEPVVTVVAPAAAAATPRQRVLRAEKSTDSDDETLTEEIAVKTKAIFDRKCFISGDPCSPASAEFWLRAYVGYIRKFARSLQQPGHPLQPDPHIVDNLPQHMKLYIKYVVKQLLANRCFGFLKQFVEHFDCIASIQSAAGISPAVVEAMRKLATYNLDSTVALDIGELGKWSMVIFSFELYADYLDHGRHRLLEVCRQNTLPQSQRYVLAKNLAEELWSEGQMAELRFAVTMLSPDLQPVEQLKFLLAGDEHTFAKLQQWFPGDARMSLRCVLFSSVLT